MSNLNATLVLDAWDVLPWARTGEERYVSPQDAMTTHAHLRAILLGYMSGLDYVVVLESGVRLHGPAPSCALHSIPSLVSSLPSDWTILQLSYAPQGGAAFMLQRQLAPFRAGYDVRVREACGVDASLRGTQAYAISRHVHT
jgi:hypothetical protein